MANSPSEMCLQQIMVVVIIQVNSQSKMMNTTRYHDSLQACLPVQMKGKIKSCGTEFNWFENECNETKTKVMTLTKHKRHRQYVLNQSKLEVHVVTSS